MSFALLRLKRPAALLALCCSASAGAAILTADAGELAQIESLWRQVLNAAQALTLAAPSEVSRAVEALQRSLSGEAGIQGV